MLYSTPSSTPIPLLSDPECCDGSDETDGKVQCPDICAKVGKEYNKRMTELENIRRAVSHKIAYFRLALS